MSDSILLEPIIRAEWNMFDQVRNIGRRAPCQDDFLTFHIMRSSQLSTWSSNVLESYWADLRSASRRGVNLLERKYAYMMRDSDPDYYAEHLAPHLPPVSDQQEELVRRITEIYAAWHRQTSIHFPTFSSRGRPAAGLARPGETSTDTYLRGELLSYSDETRARLLHMTLEAQTAGRNLVEETYSAIARQYGYPSLAKAEAALSDQGVPHHE